jgi:hypothetical protein
VGINSVAKAFALGARGSANPVQPILVARDLIGGGQVVADTEILRVTYTIGITV